MDIIALFRRPRKSRRPVRQLPRRAAVAPLVERNLPDFADPAPLRFVPRDGLTALIPAVQTQVAAKPEPLGCTDDTVQISVAAGWSAKDWYSTAHESNDWADVPVPTRSRRVLDSQAANSPDLLAAQSRVVRALRPQVLSERELDALAAETDARMRAAEAREQRMARRLSEFHEKWMRPDAVIDANRLALGMAGQNTVAAGMVEASRMRAELDALLASDGRPV